MPEVPEELDVFRLAHGHMKQLVKDMDKEVHTVRVLCLIHQHILIASYNPYSNPKILSHVNILVCLL